MTFDRTLFHGFWLAVLLSGCGQSGIVPVAGQVFWEGQPLTEAHVYFQPIGAEGSKQAGYESYARTDKDGKFTLQVVVLQQRGAIVGKHRIRISRFDNEGQPPAQQSDAGGAAPQNILPARFNTETELTFDVPHSGTDQAIFRLP